jgi:hydroxyacylglutathione hydrolase
MDVIVIPTPDLGDRSYVVHDGSVGFVVDPQRDIGRVLRAASEAGVTIAGVGETHIHNDYVMGGLALASQLGVPYLVHADDQVSFERTPVRDGDTFDFGRLHVEVVHTPGHTPNHISFFVTEEGSESVMLSGGSLLYGSVGRTDLISPEMTETLTHAQYRSAHRLVEQYPADAALLPTHGFGSFCSAVSVQETSDGTLGGERKVNIVFKYDDEDEFVAMLMASYDPFPAYYRHMGPANLAGPGPVETKPPRGLDAAEAVALVHDGALLVDLRPRTEHYEGHPTGVQLMEFGNYFTTYLGWLFEPTQELVLVTDSSDVAAEAVAALGRIGFERVAGMVDPDALAAVLGTSSLEAIDFKRYVAEHLDRPHQLLDVRNPSEHRASRLPGARQIPIYELPARLGEFDRATPVYVHCAAGGRASAAGSLLKRNGFDVVVIDDDVNRGLELLGQHTE